MGALTRVRYPKLGLYPNAPWTLKTIREDNLFG